MYTGLAKQFSVLNRSGNPVAVDSIFREFKGRISYQATSIASGLLWLLAEKDKNSASLFIQRLLSQPSDNYFTIQCALQISPSELSCNCDLYGSMTSHKDWLNQPHRAIPVTIHDVINAYNANRGKFEALLDGTASGGKELFDFNFLIAQQEWHFYAGEGHFFNGTNFEIESAIVALRRTRQDNKAMLLESEFTRAKTVRLAVLRAITERWDQQRKSPDLALEGLIGQDVDTAL